MNRLCFLVAPALLLGYGVARLIDGLDGAHGPGTAWTIGHLLFLAGLLAFGAVLSGLYRLAAERGGGARRFALGTVIVSYLGIAAFVWSVLVDLWVGWHAADRAGMNALYDQYDPPALIPALGPLFQLGLLTLLVQLALARRAPWWSPLAVLLACVGITVNLDLLPLGAVLFSLAFVPFAVLPAAPQDATEPADRIGAPL
jgi:hypothetical protein